MKERFGALHAACERRARGEAVEQSPDLTGGGEDWSRNVLIVMDEKNQLWGFMMGYSE